MTKPQKVRKKPETTELRESEKHRAKKNRDRFRQLIMELNGCVSSECLSTNKCLSTAISILSLEKVHQGSGSSSETSDSLSGSPDPKSLALVPHSRTGKELTHLLSARDCFGLGFNEQGVILYTSPNFKTTVGFKESVLGECIDKLMLRSDDILRKVFDEDNLHFICMVHLIKMQGKDVAPFHFQGKILPIQGGGRMFLGYGEKKNDIINDPIQQFQLNEVLINMDLSFVSKRNVYIDSFLGYETYSNCTTEHVVTEDMMELYKDNTAYKSLIRTFMEDGYAQHVCRLTCSDGTLLFVLAKVFMHMNQDGEPVLISYSVPFAFSTQSQETIDEGMRFITKNEHWLSLMPSFFKALPAPPAAPAQPAFSSSDSSPSEVGGSERYHDDNVICSPTAQAINEMCDHIESYSAPSHVVPKKVVMDTTTPVHLADIILDQGHADPFYDHTEGDILYPPPTSGLLNDFNEWWPQ